VGGEEIPYCQVGKGEHMRLSESLMNSRMSLGQQGVLMEMGSINLINCQVGISELLSCQVGNGKRSAEGLAYCEGSNGEILDCQVGNEMGSNDLIDCQVGSRKFPNFHMGKGKEVRLSESLMNSEESSDEQGVLTGEDQKRILIIGGIEVFLPRSPVEAKEFIADAAPKGG
jgi:hypothetical protein